MSGNTIRISDEYRKMPILGRFSPLTEVFEYLRRRNSALWLLGLGLEMTFVSSTADRTEIAGVVNKIKLMQQIILCSKYYNTSTNNGKYRVSHKERLMFFAFFSKMLDQEIKKQAIYLIGILLKIKFGREFDLYNSLNTFYRQRGSEKSHYPLVYRFFVKRLGTKCIWTK